MKNSQLIKLLLLLIPLIIGYNFGRGVINAQNVGIGNGVFTPDSSALLELRGTKGLLIPRMTTVQRDSMTSSSTPALSLLIFNISTNCFEWWDSNSNTWITMSCGCQPPVQPGSIAGNTNLCQNATGIIYSISPVSGATTYTWTVPSGATIVSGQGTTSITVNFGTTSGNISVTAGNSCGTSTAQTLAVNIQSAPSQPGAIAGNASPCQNETGVTYSISPVSGATTYTWTVPSGATIVSGQGTTSITVNFGTTSGNISVTAGNSCGTSTAQTLAVNIQSAPSQPGAIAGNTSPCQNATGITYSISPVSGATTYTWTVPSGATIVSGQGTTSITVNFGTTSGNISVTAGNSCGTSTAQTLAISLVSAPSAPTANSASNVQGTSFTANWTSVSGATGYYLEVSTSSTFSSYNTYYSSTNSYNVTGLSCNTTYYYRVRAYNSCGYSSYSNTITQATTNPGFSAKQYASLGDDRPADRVLMQTSDGGYIICRHVSGYDPLVVKTTSDGSVSWAKSFHDSSGEGCDYGDGVVQTSDGGYVLLSGYTTAYSYGSMDIALIKIASDGSSITWQKDYGTTGYEGANSIVKMTNDSLAICGSAYRTTPSSLDFWVVKFKPDGTVDWSILYGGNNYDQAYSIIKTSDNGYAICGEYGNGSNKDVLVIKLNASGTIVWSKTYAIGSGDEIGYCIRQASDGSYVVCGTTNSTGAGNNDLLLLKIKSDGTLDWGRTYGGSSDDIGRNVTINSDGTFVVTGNNKSNSLSFDKPWVMKINTDGTIAWNHTYSASGYDYYRGMGYTVIKTSDGGYAIGAKFNNMTSIFKLNSSGDGPTCEISAYISVNTPTVTTSSPSLTTTTYLVSSTNSSFTLTNQSLSPTNDCGCP